MRWRVEAHVGRRIRSAFLRKPWLTNRPVLGAVLATVAAVVTLVVLVGQFLSGALALGVVLSLAWHLWFSGHRAGFEILVGVLFGMNLLVAIGAWKAVLDQWRKRVVALETLAVACGLTVGFFLAGTWLVMVWSR